MTAKHNAYNSEGIQNNEPTTATAIQKEIKKDDMKRTSILRVVNLSTREHTLIYGGT